MSGADTLAPAAAGELERLAYESQRIGAVLPAPAGPGWWRVRGQRWRELARSGELTRRLALGAPVGAVAFAIFAFGGVYGWAYGCAYVLIFAALGAWAVQCWRGAWRARWQPLYAPLLAFLLLALVQVSGASVVAAATATALLHVGAGLVALVVVSQLYRPGQDARVLLASLAVLTATLALLAITQILTASTGIYWHFTYAYASPAGSFVNRNHFAGCMEMLIPAAVAAAYQHRQRDWLHWLPWMLAPALGVAAMVLAASRGGMLALGAEAVLGLGLYAGLRPRGRRHERHDGHGESDHEGRRPRRRNWQWTAAGVMVAAAFTWAVGTGRLSQRFATAGEHAPSLQQRLLLNRSSWTMFRQRPLLGWGLGTWAEVYPQYALFSDGTTYAYAHNDYLQMLSETGLTGAVCGLAFWGLWLWGVSDRLRHGSGGAGQTLALAAVIACGGMLVHSWVDFNLHIPANLLLFAILLALAESGARRGVKDSA